MSSSSETEVLAQELSKVESQLAELQRRMKEVDAVIDRLETARETTARALEEVSSHWDAVCRAMRRTE